MITASLKNYRISPRKVRVVADMIRGKGVAQAHIILTHAAKKAKHPLADLLASAVANASHNHKIEADMLFVKEVRVDQGQVLRRSMPMSRGTAFPIKKRTSHVSITLDTRESKVKSEKSVKSTGNAKKERSKEAKIKKPAKN